MIVIASCGHNCDDERIYYKQIKTLSSQNYSICYYTYCYKNYLDDKLDDNVEYNFFSSSEISQSQYKQILFNQLNKQPPKVLHIHDMELLSVAYLLKQKHPNIKIIYDVHEDLDAMWDTFSSYSGLIKKLINWNLARYEKQYLSCVDLFILANRLARKDKYQKFGSTHIIENFLSTQYIQKTDQSIKPYKFIYHGQLSYERGLIDLVEAFNKLLGNNDNIMLTIIGSFRTEKFKNHFLNLIQSNDKIEYIKSVSHNKIWDYLNDAHIGVIPFQDVSLCQYNTPTKLFEYMATNCAVVASELSPMQSFCFESASWAKPENISSLADAMSYYLDNANQYHKHIQVNNQLIHDQYNWERISNQLVSIYKELL